MQQHKSSSQPLEFLVLHFQDYILILSLLFQNLSTILNIT